MKYYKQLTRDNIRQGVIEIIIRRLEKSLIIDKDKISEKSLLIDDINADSLNIVELVMDFEREFAIEIWDDELDALQTVGDCINLICRKLEIE